MTSGPVSHYSVVQYVPNPIRDERVNIGVVLVCPELRYADARITNSLRRARALAPESDFSFLAAVKKDLQRTVGEFGSPTEQTSLQWKATIGAENLLLAVSRQFANAIQLTAPRGAIHDDPATLLERLHAQYVGTTLARPRAADRRLVRKVVRRELDNAGLGELVRLDVSVQGKHDEYSFDLGLVNGAPLHLITAMSFAKDDKADVRNDLYAHAWQFEDVRDGGYTGPITLVLHSIGARADLVRVGQRILQDLDGELIELPRAKEWAMAIAGRVSRDA